MSAEAVAIIGAAVGLLAVLVPLMLYLHGRLAAEIADFPELAQCVKPESPRRLQRATEDRYRTSRGASDALRFEADTGVTDDSGGSSHGLVW